MFYSVLLSTSFYFILLHSILLRLSAISQCRLSTKYFTKLLLLLYHKVVKVARKQCRFSKVPFSYNNSFLIEAFLPLLTIVAQM